MTAKQWKQLGAFAGLAAVIAMIDADTATKLVLLVGGLSLMAAAPLIARTVDELFR